MEIDNWIAYATKTLSDSDIETARLDSLILLEMVLGKDRSWLLAHSENNINQADLDSLNKFITKRSTHYPLAYITGRSHFYNNQFFVNEHVLVPRPESETIIDVLKTITPGDKAAIIDVGTGSGALAITAKLLFPKIDVIAVDIDKNALDVASKNAVYLKTNITFFESDLLESLPVSLIKDSILLANLPYVPGGFAINKSAKLEPKAAIFGGINGLDLYSKLFDQIKAPKSQPTYVITESLPQQHSNLESIASGAGYRCLETNDFIQLFSHLQ
jgi:release factor glutamine methyltransferase